MKIKTSKITELKCIYLSRSELKPEIRKGIRSEGLYFLENIFGGCDGHGCGGGEDISFTLKPKTKFNRKSYEIVFEVHDDGRKLEIGERIFLYTHKDKRHKDFHDMTNDDVSPELVKAIQKSLVKKY